MNTSLFNLISKAGSASLGELNARSSFAPDVLAREIAKMLRDGVVVLSKPENLPSWVSAATLEESARQNTAFTIVMELLDNPGKLVEFAQSNTGQFVEGIEFALKDERAAESINVNPTSKGFRSSVA
jgi:hypothetical protein